MGELSKVEYEIVQSLKKRDALYEFKIEELKNLTLNGGIAIICGDGDIDVRRYHSRMRPCRPHSIMVFGGPLVFAPSFRGYSEFLVRDLCTNMRWGMEAKDTKSIFLYFHYPCGVASKFDYSIFDVLLKVPEVVSSFEQNFKGSNIHTFFHAKRRNRRGLIKQNTYRFAVPAIPEVIELQKDYSGQWRFSS